MFKEFLQKYKFAFFYIGVIILLSAVFFIGGRCSADNSKQSEQDKLIEQYREQIKQLSDSIGKIEQINNQFERAVNNGITAINNSIAAINGSQGAVSNSSGLSNSIESTNSIAESDIRDAIELCKQLRKQIE